MNIFDWLTKNLHDSPKQTIGGVIGFFIALIFIVIGFWNFILIVLITLIGLTIGRLAGNNWDISSSFRSSSANRGRDSDDGRGF